MATKFVVIATSLSGKFCEDEQNHVDMRLVPELPNSGNTVEAVLKDIGNWAATCNVVQKSGKLQGMAPLGETATEQQVDLPIQSSEGNPYSLNIDGDTLRAKFWQAISNMHQVEMRSDLTNTYGKDQPSGGRKVKGFVVKSA